MILIVILWEISCYEFRINNEREKNFEDINDEKMIDFEGWFKISGPDFYVKKLFDKLYLFFYLVFFEEKGTNDTEFD